MVHVGQVNFDDVVYVSGAAGGVGSCVVQFAKAGSAVPSNFRNVIHRELTLRGFTVTAHEDLRPTFETDVRGWIEQRKIRSVHIAFDGIDMVPEAFESLLTGRSTGRVVVSVASQLP